MNINTNTVISVFIALILFYVFVRVVTALGKFVVLIVFAGVILFGIQSLGIYNIPVVNKVYPQVAKIVPYKQIWAKTSVYKDEIHKAIKIENDLNK